MAIHHLIKHNRQEKGGTVCVESVCFKGQFERNWKIQDYAANKKTRKFKAMGHLRKVRKIQVHEATEKIARRMVDIKENS